jgi:hypothetical protein
MAHRRTQCNGVELGADQFPRNTTRPARGEGVRPRSSEVRGASLETGAPRRGGSMNEDTVLIIVTILRIIAEIVSANR